MSDYNATRPQVGYRFCPSPDVQVRLEPLADMSPPGDTQPAKRAVRKAAASMMQPAISVQRQRKAHGAGPEFHVSVMGGAAW